MTLSLVTAFMFLALAMLDSIAAAVAVPAYNRPRLDQHHQRNTPSLIVMKSIRK